MTPQRARRVLAVGAAVLAAALVPVPAAVGRPAPSPGVLTPGLAATLDGLPTGAVTTVVVTLSRELDPGAAGRTRPHRAAAVVATLKEQSRVAQAPLLARLAGLGRAGGVARTEPFWVADAVSVTATAPVIREIARRGDVASVRPDALTLTPAASAEWNVTATGAPTLWAGGSTGAGAVVAVLDSGVDLSHTDLASRWRGGTNSWFDPFGQHSTPADASGHGTGATGIIAGGDDVSAYGVAPGATWIAARVFDDSGASSVTALHRVFQWLLDPDGDAATDDAPDVVNGSWALGSGPSCDLALQPDVLALREAGILPVFAAGNFGPSGSSSVSPANYPESLSVGAVDAQEGIWAYTSSGPSTCGGRTRVFPDLVAPGVSVLTADRYGGYQYLTGTSIAAPHVAGALALLIGANLRASVAGVEGALVSTAVDLGAPGADDRYGNGRIDVAAAEASLSSVSPPPTAADFSVSVDPASVTVRRGSSGAVSVTVDVLSGSPEPVTLQVAGTPSGVTVSWTGSPVAAPGTAVLTLEVAKKGVRRGSYFLDLTGTSGSLSRSTPLTLEVR
jgi:subtilisin family serine protease